MLKSTVYVLVERLIFVDYILNIHAVYETYCCVIFSGVFVPSGSAGHGDEGRWMHALASQSHQRDAASNSSSRIDHQYGGSSSPMNGGGGFDDDAAGSGLFDARGRRGASAAAATAAPFALQTLAELIDAIPPPSASSGVIAVGDASMAAFGSAASADAVTLMTTHVLATAVEVGYDGWFY